MSQKLSPWQILTSNEKYLEREKSEECTTAVRVNAADLAERVSKLLDHLGRGAVVSSGFRTLGANGAASGAKRSAHLTGEAVDLEDRDKSLAAAILASPNLLVQYDLYLEHPDYTATWVHLQTRPTKSGSRIFKP